jgi:hypothetical protein
MTDAAAQMAVPLDDWHVILNDGSELLLRAAGYSRESRSLRLQGSDQRDS